MVFISKSKQDSRMNKQRRIGNRPRKMAVINLFTRSEGPSSPQRGQLIKFCQSEVFPALADWCKRLLTGLLDYGPDIMLLSTIEGLCIEGSDYNTMVT